MENNDTLLEMQQQLKQLKATLDNQTIVNRRIMRTAMDRKKTYLRIKTSVPILAGIAGIGILPILFSKVGLPLWFMIFTIILFLVAIVATVLAKGHLPRLDRDLLSATEELTRFRKISADWIKYGLPALIVWLGMFIWQILSCTDIGESEMYGLFGGIAVGLVIGLTLGLKNRRDILNGTDELLDQIEELKKEA